MSTLGLDGPLEALLAETTPALREALRRAYELGYREAIATGSTRVVPSYSDPSSTVHADVTEASSSMVEPDAPAGTIGRLLSDEEPSVPAPQAAPKLLEWDKDSVEDDDEEDDDPHAQGGQRRHRRRIGIRTTSTVGALKNKIAKQFRLDRFAIDVVITRAGDRTRRQIPSHVTLSAYLREE